MSIVTKQITLSIISASLSLFFLTGCFGPPASIKHEENGRQFLNDNKYSKAIEEFSKAISKNPNNSFAYNNRGIAYASLKQYELAINDFSKAIELKPELLEPYNNRGFVLELKGETKLAIEDFSQSTRINENNEVAKNNLANARRKIGDLQQTINDLSEKIDQTTPPQFIPEDQKQEVSNLYIERAIAKYELFTQPKGQKPATICKTSQYCNMVIADLAISIQIEPNNPKSHRILGLTYRALENFDKALSSFNKSIELDKSDETALYERGWTYMEMMQPYKALEDIDESITLNPENSHIYRLRSWILMSLGEWEKAKSDVDFLLDLYPQDPNLHYLLGLINIHSGSIVEGLKDISIAQSFLGNQSEPAYILASSQGIAKQENYSQALENLNSALQLDNKYTYGYLLKARMNMNVQNFQEVKTSSQIINHFSLEKF